MRALENATAAASAAAGGANITSLQAAAQAAGPVADIPFSQLFSDWVAFNSPPAGNWQRQQVLAANALATINVQVRLLFSAVALWFECSSSGPWVVEQALLPQSTFRSANTAAAAHFLLTCHPGPQIINTPQTLLNANVTRVSTLRYGDAKTLPAIDVHLTEGFDAVPMKLLPVLNVSYSTGGLGFCNRNVQRVDGTGQASSQPRQPD